MIVSASKKSPPQKKRRRWGMALFIGIIVLLFFGGRTYLNPNRYIPLIESALSDAIGLPARIGHIDVDLGSDTQIVLSDITVGETEFSGAVHKLTLTLSPADLWHRTVTISSILTDEVLLNIPENIDDAYVQIQAVVDHINRDRPPSSWTVNVDKIDLPVIRIETSEHPLPLITGSLSGRHLTGDEIDLKFNADLNRHGERAKAESEIKLIRGRDAKLTIQGSGSLTHFETVHMAIPGVPDITVHSTFRFLDTDPGTYGIELAGSVESDIDPALAGLFSTTLWHNDGSTELREVTWEAQGLTVQASVTFQKDGSVQAEIRELIVTENAMQSLLEMARTDEGHLQPLGQSNLTCRDVQFDWSPGEWPYFSQGTLEINGVNAVLESGGDVFRNGRVHISIENDIITIHEFKSDFVEVRGTIHPDYEALSATLDLQGYITLHDEQAALIPALENVKGLQGDLAVESLKGTFVLNQGIPDDLVISGTLQNGKITVARGYVEYRIDAIDARFKSTAKTIETTIRAESENYGPIAIKGGYQFASQQWKGTAEVNAFALVTPLINNEQVQRHYVPILAEFRTLVIQTQIDMPSKQRRDITARFSKEGLPGFDAEINFINTTEQGWRLGSIDAMASLPLDDLEYLYFDGVMGTGTAQIHFQRQESDETFKLGVDLTSTALRTGDYFHKRLRDPLLVELTGAAGNKWALTQLTVSCLNEVLPFTFEDGALALDATTINLASLTPLLPDDASARGTLILSYAPDKTLWDVSLDNAGLTVEPDLDVQSVSGDIQIIDGYPTCEGLRILGAQSDFTVTAARVSDGWKGDIRGHALDVNAVLEFIDAVIAFRDKQSLPEGAQDPLTTEPYASPNYWDNPFIGDLQVTFDELTYQFGSITNVSANINAEADGIHVVEFSVRPDDGSITGRVDIVHGIDGSTVLKTNLEFDQFNIQLADEMFLEEPHNIQGLITGTASFEAPLGDPRGVMATGSGQFNWSAIDGTLGRIPLATRLLTALRTVDIINLGAPSLRDRGLTFRTLDGKASMVDGLLTLEDMLLSDLSYAMEFHGNIDYAKDETDVRVFVRLLESISNLANRIPGVRIITARTTKRIGVHVMFSGPPSDTNTSVSVTGLRVIKNTIKRPFRRNNSKNPATPEDTSQEELPGEEPKLF